MSADANRIVNKLWSYCNVLRDDGLSYGDYLEQLTYLLFLKMADEQTRAPWKRPRCSPFSRSYPAICWVRNCCCPTSPPGGAVRFANAPTPLRDSSPWW